MFGKSLKTAQAEGLGLGVGAGRCGYGQESIHSSCCPCALQNQDQEHRLRFASIRHSPRKTSILPASETARKHQTFASIRHSPRKTSISPASETARKYQNLSSIRHSPRKQQNFASIRQPTQTSEFRKHQTADANFRIRQHQTQPTQTSELCQHQTQPTQT